MRWRRRRPTASESAPTVETSRPLPRLPFPTTRRPQGVVVGSSRKPLDANANRALVSDPARGPYSLSLSHSLSSTDRRRDRKAQRRQIASFLFAVCLRAGRDDSYNKEASPCTSACRMVGRSLNRGGLTDEEQMTIRDAISGSLLGKEGCERHAHTNRQNISRRSEGGDGRSVTMVIRLLSP